jgi:hypothetical protein
VALCPTGGITVSLASFLAAGPAMGRRIGSACYLRKREQQIKEPPRHLLRR